MANGDPEGESKRGFPGGLLPLILVAFFVIMLVQSMTPSKTGKVGFSYQLEHLMNLDLVRPEEAVKTSLNERLVTFSGRFRDQVSDQGRARWRYLELLNQRMSKREQHSALELAQSASASDAKASASLYLHITGTPVPKGGYVVIESKGQESPGLVVSEDRSSTAMTLRELEQALTGLGISPSLNAVEEVEGQFLAFFQLLKGTELGIGSEAVKSQLRALREDLETPSLSDQPTSERLAHLQVILEGLNSTLAEMAVPVQGVRLQALSSVRDFVEDSQELARLDRELAENQVLLDRARLPLGNPVWFYRDQEMSTRQLEQQEPEKFQQWFGQAKAEWDAFAVNHSLPFRAPDQPRNLVLERSFRSQEPAPNYLGYLITFAPVLLIGGLLYFLLTRQVKGAGGGAMSFGKAPIRIWQKGAGRTTFKDVAGIEEAKEELTEIVDFLKDPGKFTTLGARIPRGALLIGAPGTGKTLMAKAVAGEADRPFFSISGSDFVEMFVGVGASRIRDLFEQAKKNAPCIVFIDEIDAVGRHRGGGWGGGHDEREQTLNQLLVEMDGFGTNEGIILMAATNRPDVLDKALLRPGRFDRRIIIDLPDLKGRFEILKVHARKLKLDPDVDLMAVARATPGSSGADLANVLNEAALLAARRGRSAISGGDVTDACDKVRFGKARRSLELDEKEKLTTAYHEIGHTMVGLVVEHADPVEKVTIIPRGLSLGATHFLPEKNRLSYWKKQVLDQLAVLMGGRAAEELFVGDISSGAQQDIRQATTLARTMVCEWGMSDHLGLIAYEEPSENGQYLGMNSYHDKKYSEITAEQIDQEVRKLVDQAYQRACEILESRRQQVDLMSHTLLEFETLDAEDVKEILEGRWDPEKKKERLQLADQKFIIQPPPIPPGPESRGPGGFDLAPVT